MGLVGRLSLAALLCAGAVSAPAAYAGLVPPAAVAITVLPGEQAFCNAWHRFGDRATFDRLSAVHYLAQNANDKTADDYGVFEWMLLNHESIRVIRNKSAAVWNSCGYHV